ncbi:universal stress protein [Undibacterium sp. FT79W]|uniref:universal stress protein n=1 Tax=Undibacterium sp. FT79W TaxID=2762296 RepID=UPI00164C49EA|nr:universal stress protein [Undibacterium sp. FT79W]MBC3878338.1 universal stress protein [Undibacterium sp. FT79W]
MFQHILVPTDGSALSQAAIEKAVLFAKESGARISFFCAAQAATMYDGLGGIFSAQTPATLRNIANNISQEILAAAEKQAQIQGVPCTTLSQIAEQPYAAIIEAATLHGCDLIFMASHGRRGLDALLLGSETQKVLTHSTIPVLVYR